MNSVNKVKYLKLNLSNKKKVLSLLSKIKPDIVIHFGSSNPSYNEMKKKKNFYDKNFLETKILIDALLLLKIKIKFVFANSAQILKSKNKKKKIDEKTEFYKYNDYTKFRYNIFKYLKKKKNPKFKFVNLILLIMTLNLEILSFYFPELLNISKIKF